MSLPDDPTAPPPTTVPPQNSRRSRRLVIGSAAGGVVLLLCLCVGGLAAYGLSPAGRNAAATRTALTVIAQASMPTATVKATAIPSSVSEIPSPVTAQARISVASATVVAVPLVTSTSIPPTGTSIPLTNTPLLSTATPTNISATATLPPAPSMIPPTSTPTMRPPTATLTVASTTVPTNTPLPPSASGGLGLSKSEVEKLYGKGNPSTANRNNVAYDDRGMQVSYPFTVPQNVDQVTRTWDPEIALEVGRTEIKAYMPADAQFIQTLTVRNITVDVYRSAWLATRFPKGPWGKGEPGSFTILCQTTADRFGGNRRTRCAIDIGDAQTR